MYDKDEAVREQVARLLEGRQAHVDVGAVLDRVRFEDLSRKPEGAPWTLWELFEHMRIAQVDILEFSRNPEHISPEFPRGYWPSQEAPQSEDEWHEHAETFRRELAEMKTFILDPATDLHARIPHGDGQTVFREALLVADHNAYHLGQMVLMMKLLQRWEGRQ